jgi:hypothetical protein
MSKQYDEDGNDQVVGNEVKYECGPIVGPYNYPIQYNGRFSVDPVSGNVGIGTPVKLDPSMNIGIGEQNYKYKLVCSNNSDWARVDKDNNLVHLDMDLCAKGPANAYTALAVGIWNAAIDEAARYAAGEGDDTLADSIRELKK